ncbi:neogenin [Galendromus occidentalis]|uniref:Neogenin n=1 Tax=Galendromus occidentalis TaxID=34638 RepID=A0AAJ6QK78_9ACAR|nr:neogenin [Galendromus occidentalis]
MWFKTFSTVFALTQLFGPSSERALELSVISSSQLKAAWQMPLDRTSSKQYSLALSTTARSCQQSVIERMISPGEKECLLPYNETDTLYTLTVSAQEGSGGNKTSEEILSASIVVPKIGDSISLPPPEVVKISPTNNSVKFNLKEPQNEYSGKRLRLVLISQTGRLNKSSIFETQAGTLYYGSDLKAFEEYFGSLQRCENNLPEQCGMPTQITFKTLIGAPSVPKDLEITFVNESRIEVRWEPPVDMGAPNVDHYEVKLIADEKLIGNITVSNETLTSAFDHLRSGISYTVELTAVNIDGSKESFYSEPAAVMVSTPSSVPIWIFVAVIIVGVAAGTAFFVIKTKT